MNPNDFTDLLGDDLIQAGFRLYIKDKCQHLLLNGKELLHTYPDDHSLQAIKQFCARYLADENTPKLQKPKQTGGHHARI